MHRLTSGQRHSAALSLIAHGDPAQLFAPPRVLRKDTLHNAHDRHSPKRQGNIALRPALRCLYLGGSLRPLRSLRRIGFPA